MNTTLYQMVKSLQYYYQYSRTGYHGRKSINWFDGRTAVVKTLKDAGISKEDAASILRKIIERRKRREITNEIMSMAERISFLKMVAQCTFDTSATSSRYNRTGIDWKAYHRISSSGGWVLIAPDEPGNNWHTKDPLIVKFLTKKFMLGNNI